MFELVEFSFFSSSRNCHYFGTAYFEEILLEEKISPQPPERTQTKTKRKSINQTSSSGKVARFKSLTFHIPFEFPRSSSNSYAHMEIFFFTLKGPM